MHISFLAMIFRMRHISRWSLMHNTQPESLSQHTTECAFLVHFLANVGNLLYGKNYDAEKLCACALYHDAPEILTGDLPTPIKYFSAETRDAYRQIESAAAARLLEHLPEELRGLYSSYLDRESLREDERTLLKIADKLCAYIKCLVEAEAGNREFSAALSVIRKDLGEFVSEELAYFLEHCLEAFTLPLDKLGGAL